MNKEKRNRGPGHRSSSSAQERAGENCGDLSAAVGPKGNSSRGRVCLSKQADPIPGKSKDARHIRNSRAHIQFRNHNRSLTSNKQAGGGGRGRAPHRLASELARSLGAKAGMAGRQLGSRAER